MNSILLCWGVQENSYVAVVILLFNGMASETKRTGCRRHQE
ncbi:hypothetical protein 22664BS2_074 [Escherichia phage vB_EcoS-22664BS2]|nr:hypothetical protein QCF79_gp74 [Escherichia phage vB_EcoS-22664BS2]QZI78563.1 hypothetical protein 22664BS2_074 [Escherichia phage vB_EcoS-22664BS2]